MADPIIQFDNVRFAYAGSDDEALRGVTCAVNAGEYVCVLGGNGSGKSTMAQLINALAAPTSGHVRVLGIDTAAEPDRALEIRRQVAMVFQYPDDQMVTSIVADDVAFGPENLGAPHGEIVRRVDVALSAVEMAEFAQADPADLSGGQRQRVAIAGALAMDPRVLVLDEPAAMLDPAGRAAIQRIVHALRARGITIVHITHFMDDALAADRVIVLDRGRIALDDTPGEVFAQRDALRALGLELPFTVRLAEALAPEITCGSALPALDEIADAAAAAISAASQQRGTFLPKTDASDAISGKNVPLNHTTDRIDPNAAPAIAFEDVSFSYADERHPHKRSGLLARLGVRTRQRMPCRADTLRELSFAVPADALTALIGRTGSGKSTSVELACALKLPNLGTVRVGGIATDDLARRADVRAQIGFVAQLPERQLFAGTVFDDVAFGPRNLGLAEQEVEARVRRAIEAVGYDPTPQLLERSPFALSGGQQRRIAIAGVLAMDTPVLVLDEPMAGLDPQARNHMRSLIRSLRQHGKTLLVVTHDMNDVAELADHVVALDHGALVAEGTPRQVFCDAAPSGQLPGAPDACSFAHELAARGITLPRTPLTLDELAQEVHDVCTR